MTYSVKLSSTKGVAVNTKSGDIPYLVIDVSHKPIQDEPKIKGRLQFFEKNVLRKEYNIWIEYRGKTSFLMSDKNHLDLKPETSPEKIQQCRF